jgi:probable F420-dependent oxidoreductase
VAQIGTFGLDVGIYGPLATTDTILSLARWGEQVGFESLWVADHIAFPVSFSSEYPYSARGDFPSQFADPLMEPLATMGVLVGATQRVRIGAAVLILPYRNPLLLARMMVTLDQLSRGRMILGAGTGWLQEEFEALGAFDFKKRGRVTDEYIEIFKAVSAGGEVGYQGETYTFAPVISQPGSMQRPHPPILIGGLSTPALRRVARHGNGWMAVTAGPEQLAACIGTLRTQMAESNRPFDELSLTYKMFLGIGQPKRSRFDAREPGTGSADQIIDDLKRIVALGFTRIIVRYRGSDAEEQRRQLDLFVDKIAPKV